MCVPLGACCCRQEILCGKAHARMFGRQRHAGEVSSRGPLMRILTEAEFEVAAGSPDGL